MTKNINEVPLGRRSFIKGAAFGLGAVALGGPLLSACGAPSPSTLAGPSSMVALPTYVAQAIPKPDLEAPNPQVQNTYLRYPAEKITTVKGAVGTGKSVTALVMTYSQPPAALAQNSYWQFINKELNIDFQPVLAAANDFSAKFAATMAGSDIPDMVSIPVFLGLPRVQEMYKSIFQDLSEFLSGDAIKDYPNLANIDTDTWKYCRVDGKIIGIPAQRPTIGRPFLVRKDIFDKLGVNYNPANAAEFEEMCKAVTDPKANRYALSGAAGGWCDDNFAGMFGVPNGWRHESNGSLIRDIETEEFKESVAFRRKLWEGGYWHPDSANQQTANAQALFVSGNIMTFSEGFPRWSTIASGHPDIDIDAMKNFGANGGDGTQLTSRPLFSVTSLKKTEDKERVKELLRILDYLCAPFGSQENFNIAFGVEGSTFEVENGVPTLTKKGSAEKGVSIDRLANGPQSLFSPVPIDDSLKRQFEFQVAIAPIGVSDPAGQYWPITVPRMASLDDQITSGITAVITGRKPVDHVDELANTWRNGGGDELRKKLEAAIAADAK
ncbi:ABC-type sugar transport system, periplasmic component [Arthrobacter sp. PAMC 25486]|uniref:extracellular solute-binding protein n=1 Tax=Arthrobacter sp. PAMC 25486 TaxID=1494608 RepID=UPI0005359ECA|nr:extracellular solute-binding protein [Arthrobacter sp. PAMC 25486]AIY03195.1 ABC-type sugar transport system, periplasmic component [Arthrobacter sp. PAMC 25486]